MALARFNAWVARGCRAPRASQPGTGAGRGRLAPAEIACTPRGGGVAGAAIYIVVERHSRAPHRRVAGAKDELTRPEDSLGAEDLEADAGCTS